MAGLGIQKRGTGIARVGLAKGGKAFPDLNKDGKITRADILKGRGVFKDGGSKWIQSAIKKPGSLRATLKVKKGEKIPMSKLKAAAKKSGVTGKRARLAMTLKGMK